jgi:predicted permease
LGGTVLVFAVMCANVSGVLITQLTARRHEYGLCAALGASRVRLMREAAFEHILIAAAGAAAGVGVASLMTAVVPAVFQHRTLNPIDIDPRALGAAAALGISAVLLSGVAPAWLATRSTAMGVWTVGRHRNGETKAASAAMRALLVGEIALACSLLIGAALLARSVVNLATADRGTDVEGVVQVRVTSLDEAFPSIEAMASGTAAIDAVVRTWPEVESVALSREVPAMGAAGILLAASDPDQPAEDADRLWFDRYRVTNEFFSLYRIPLLAGRSFLPGDTEGDVIIGERLAAMLLPGQDPVGRTLPLRNSDARRVIGVAREMSLPTLDRDLDRPEYYVPLGSGSRTLYLNLRCRVACPPDAIMRERLRAVHPAISARSALTSAAEYQRHLDLPRATARVGTVFAVIAVVAAGAGLFGVLSHAVSRRRREFGIRAALGASPAQMSRVVLRQGLLLAGAGAGVGAFGGLAVGRALATLQYGVTAGDPVSWISVLAVLWITTVAATWRPARTARRADPVTLLREE